MVLSTLNKQVQILKHCKVMQNMSLKLILFHSSFSISNDDFDQTISFPMWWYWSGKWQTLGLLPHSFGNLWYGVSRKVILQNLDGWYKYILSLLWHFILPNVLSHQRCIILFISLNKWLCEFMYICWIFHVHDL